MHCENKKKGRKDGEGKEERRKEHLKAEERIDTTYTQRVVAFAFVSVSEHFSTLLIL